LESWDEVLQSYSSDQSYHCRSQVKHCIDIAFRCTNYDRDDRPSIGEIVHGLLELDWPDMKAPLEIDLAPVEDIDMPRDNFLNTSYHDEYVYGLSSVPSWILASLTSGGIEVFNFTNGLWYHYSGDLFSPYNNWPYLELHGHSNEVCVIQYFTNKNSETFLVSGSMDGTARVWKIDEEPTPTRDNIPFIEPHATLEHTSGVTAVCFIAELEIIITGLNDGTVYAWNAIDGTISQKSVLHSVPRRVYTLRYLSGGSSCSLLIGHKFGFVPKRVYLDELFKFSYLKQTAYEDSR
jgi:WD40 repeat protein